jgi:hypothetical protein
LGLWVNARVSALSLAAAQKRSTDSLNDQQLLADSIRNDILLLNGQLGLIQKTFRDIADGKCTNSKIC